MMNELIMIGLKASIILVVFSLGVSANMHERKYLLRRPKLIARSLFAMNIVMPLVAAGLAAAFDLRPVVKIALVALAVSPVPPMLPRKEIKAGGTTEYVVSLLVWAALLSIVFVPLAMALLGNAFGFHVRVPAADILKIVLLSVVIPLFAGMLVRRVWPGFAQRAGKALSNFAFLLLLVCCVPLLVVSMPKMFDLLGSGTLLAIVAMSVVGHAVGHMLGGPESDNRTVLALSTATRHPAVAIAIAHAGFPTVDSALVAVLLALVVNLFISAAYLAWRRHSAEGPKAERRWRARARHAHSH